MTPPGPLAIYILVRLGLLTNIASPFYRFRHEAPSWFILPGLWLKLRQSFLHIADGYLQLLNGRK